MTIGTDRAREEAQKYSERVSISRRFHGDIYIGSIEYTTITDAVRKAFFDGYSKGREDCLEEKNES